MVASTPNKISLKLHMPRWERIDNDNFLYSCFYTNSCLIIVSPVPTTEPVLKVKYTTVWQPSSICSPSSVWYQSTPSSAWCSSSLSGSRILKSRLEMLSGVCFHFDSFSHGQRPSHTHTVKYTHIAQKPQLCQLWELWEAQAQHLVVGHVLKEPILNY